MSACRVDLRSTESGVRHGAAVPYKVFEGGDRLKPVLHHVSRGFRDLGRGRDA